MTPSRPVLDYNHVRWLRDIMRDAGCPRLQREAMERFIDGESVHEAAAALGRSVDEMRQALDDCRASLKGRHLVADADEVFERAARVITSLAKNEPQRGGTHTGASGSPSSDTSKVARSWSAWAWSGEW